MKIKFHHRLRPVAACLALVAGAFPAAAQSNGVPGPDDFAAFSRFITDRNIFDPSRQPHSPGVIRPRTRARTRTSAPGIQFVGTMSYEKGQFAFFSGNSPELSKVAQVGDKVADYTVAQIDVAANSVRLQAADKTVRPLKAGDGLREENGKWVVAEAGDLPAADSGSESTGPADAGSAGSAATPASAPSTAEPNEVLKRLMQLREKENQ